MGPAQNHPEPPPLPPSPLTEVREGVPFRRLPLPWLTLLFAFLTGPVAALVPMLVFVRGHSDALFTAAAASGILGARGLLLAAGAALADRGLPSWSRMARWGLGMTLVGVVLDWRDVVGLVGGAIVGAPLYLPIHRLGWLAAVAIREGLVGALSGCFLSRDRDRLWRPAIGAAVIWSSYVAIDLALSGPWSDHLPGREAGQVVLTWLLAGSLLPVAFALGLRLAWRRARGDGTAEGE